MPRPAGSFVWTSAAVTSTVSSRLPVLMALACSAIASHTAAVLASDAVCDWIARAPAGVRPPFQSTTGFVCATSRRSGKKRRPSRRPSMYITITSTSGSFA